MNAIVRTALAGVLVVADSGAATAPCRIYAMPMQRDLAPPRALPAPGILCESACG